MLFEQLRLVPLPGVAGHDDLLDHVGGVVDEEAPDARHLVLLVFLDRKRVEMPPRLLPVVEQLRGHGHDRQRDVVIGRTARPRKRRADPAAIARIVTSASSTTASSRLAAPRSNRVHRRQYYRADPAAGCPRSPAHPSRAAPHPSRAAPPQDLAGPRRRRRPVERPGPLPSPLGEPPAQDRVVRERGQRPLPGRGIVPPERRRLLPPATSRNTGMSLATTGVPAAIASTSGKPKPSYSEGQTTASAPR